MIKKNLEINFDKAFQVFNNLKQLKKISRHDEMLMNKLLKLFNSKVRQQV